MTSQSFGHFLSLEDTTGTVQHRFQNFWIDEDVDLNGNSFSFLPFAFSGTTVTKSGDNQPAVVAFPNNDLARGWAEVAVRERWLVRCRTALINLQDRNSGTVILSRYFAQIVSCTWNETALELQLASVLDAVGSDVPRKKLTRQLVGRLPLTARVRIQ